MSETPKRRPVAFAMPAEPQAAESTSPHPSATALPTTARLTGVTAPTRPSAPERTKSPSKPSSRATSPLSAAARPVAITTTLAWTV